MLIGLACHDHNDHTWETMEHLRTSASSQLRVIIIDNNSIEPYKESDYEGYPFEVSVLTNGYNVGHYYTLWQLYQKYGKEEALIGLMHNDLWIYEKDWDVRMTNCFLEDPLLASVGLCGSNEVDEHGGRGGGTKCHFRGAIGGKDPSSVGEQITGLVPAAVFDSLFMMFRTNTIPFLMNETDKWENLPLGHFYDRIWPLRLVERGFHVGVLGVECDHWSGVTALENARYRENAAQWLDQHGYDYYENPEEGMYAVAEHRYLKEYRDIKHIIPCWIGLDYEYHKI